MTIEQVRDVYGARPFRAFRLYLADGRSLDVQHPEFMSFSRSGRIISVAKSNDAFEIVDLCS